MTRRGRTFDGCRLTNNGPTDESVLAILLSKPGQFRWTPPIILWLRGTEIKSITWMHHPTSNGPSGHSLPAISKVEAPEFFLILRGVFWSFWANFHRVGSISNIFGGRFSHFHLFSDFGTRETNASKLRTMYCPSGNEYSSPPIGPQSLPDF